MDWYDELSRYFPSAEMRPRAHFQWLIDHRPDIYRVAATAEHLLLYLEYDDVLFIDYLYVYPDHRGAGEGSRVLQWLKQHDKAVLLEVEPASAADPDSVRRRQFYDRLQFRQVSDVRFRLPHPLLGAGTDLDVLCWAPGEVPPARIYQWMQRMYQDLYASIDPAIYGKPYPPVADCLRLSAPRKDVPPPCHS